jgi:hypothetical protein
VKKYLLVLILLEIEDNLVFINNRSNLITLLNFLFNHHIEIIVNYNWGICLLEAKIVRIDVLESEIVDTNRPRAIAFVVLYHICLKSLIKCFTL